MNEQESLDEAARKAGINPTRKRRSRLRKNGRPRKKREPRAKRVKYALSPETVTAVHDAIKATQQSRAYVVAVLAEQIRPAEIEAAKKLTRIVGQRMFDEILAREAAIKEAQLAEVPA